MKIEPENFDLWNRFQSCERNEMIITKSGRCLFPVLKFNVQIEESDAPISCLDSPFSYALGMERIDSYKWKYRHNQWYATSSNDSSQILEPISHLYEPEPSSVLWSQILREGLNFSKVKLTNRKGSQALTTISSQAPNTSNRLSSSSNLGNSNYFSLSSFGNYVPVVYLLDWNSFFHHHPEFSVSVSITAILRNYDSKVLENEGSLRCIQVKECSFIAVTHYQNEVITHLKKHNNPHAKGFILTDESVNKFDSPIQRGKPGRKRKIPPLLEFYATQDGDTSYSPSEDVIMASLALEKMSSGNVPRSENLASNQKSEHVVEYKFENDNGNYKFLTHYNNKSK